MGDAGPFLGFASMLSTGLGNGYEEAQKKIELENNKQLADQSAADALARGNLQGGQSRIQGSKVIGAQNVAYAASGVDPTQGTAADVMADTRMMSELDAKTHENNAAREAWGYRKFGINFQQQAAINASRSGFRTASTLLGGSGKILSGLGRYMNDSGSENDS